MKPFSLAAAIVLTSNLALAQTSPMQMASLMNANQLGVLEYCQSKGWTDQASVDAQRGAGVDLPPPTDVSAVSDAEARGRTGELLNNGSPLALADMARQTNTTEQALCGKLGAAATMVAAQRRAMPAMPKMPGGMAMPPLPNGMTMPAMPKPQ